MTDCLKCDGHCCKYVTVNIDKPADNIDFEELKWFLCHKNIMVYIDHDGDWCVEFGTPCKHQDPKTNLCTMYKGRPDVCSDHQADECEEYGHGDPYQRVFRTVEDIDEYRREIQSSQEASKVRSEGNGKAKMPG